jgi:hypothetical protein
MPWLDRQEYLSARLKQIKTAAVKLPTGFAHWLARCELGEFGFGSCIVRPKPDAETADLLVQDIQQRKKP